MADLKQLTKALKKSLDNFDIDKRISHATNETTTSSFTTSNTAIE